MSKQKQSPAEPALRAGTAHTFRQGSSLVTVVTDGYISVPEAVVTAGADRIAREAITDRLPKVTNGVLAHANIPIVTTGSDVIVFDVGGGGRYQPTEGRFVGNLHAAGIAASTVTKVVLTHAHPDHVWGIQDENGAALFPDATYYMPLRCRAWVVTTSPLLGPPALPTSCAFLGSAERGRFFVPA